MDEGGTPEGLLDSDRAVRVRLVGSMLFSAAGPVARAQIQEMLPGEDLDQVIADLDGRLAHVGLSVRSVDGGYDMVTTSQTAAIIGRHADRPGRRVQRSLMETLAAVARLQPCTRGDVSDARGVEVRPESFTRLADLGWIERAGRQEALGRPSVWRTTRKFLEDFGLPSLASLSDL